MMSYEYKLTFHLLKSFASFLNDSLNLELERKIKRKLAIKTQLNHFIPLNTISTK